MIKNLIFEWIMFNNHYYLTIFNNYLKSITFLVKEFNNKNEGLETSPRFWIFFFREKENNF